MWIFVWILVGVLGLMVGLWFAKRKQNKDSAQVAELRTKPADGRTGAGGRYRQDPEEQSTVVPAASRAVDASQSNPALNPVFAYTLVGSNTASERPAQCSARESTETARQADNTDQGGCGGGDSGGTTSGYGDSSSAGSSYDSNP